MSQTNKKQMFLHYYTEDDRAEVTKKLPDIIKEAVVRAGEILEPTIDEKKMIMVIIKNFIKKKKRIVYGGTALNEAVKLKNPEDVFYDNRIFSDIEFYSPTPVPDLVELTNILYQKGLKYVEGKEAQHDETYTVFVNLQSYCDISYVPLRIYNGIKKIVIEEINYVDPHFALIDYLRMVNDPMNAADQRWEKAFKRMYVLFKNYPLEYYDKFLTIKAPNDEYQTYLSKIKQKFLLTQNVQQSCLIAGFDAYNFFIRHAIGDNTVDKMARVTFDSNKLKNFLSNVPFFEFISVDYVDTVEKLYNYIKSIVIDPKELTLTEYYPLFQFTNHTTVINYKKFPLVKIIDADGFCVPNIKTAKGYMYVSYQYLLMLLLINKFRCHLDKNKEMYFNYNVAVSNLVDARNIFLDKNNLGVINNTVFGEFKVGCVGSTVSYRRLSLLRMIEKKKDNKKRRPKFGYHPETFFKLGPEIQAKFDPTRHTFKNTSGNEIMNSKNLMFKIDSDGNIHKDSDIEESYVEASEANVESADIEEIISSNVNTTDIVVPTSV